MPMSNKRFQCPHSPINFMAYRISHKFDLIWFESLYQIVMNWEAFAIAESKLVGSLCIYTRGYCCWSGEKNSKLNSSWNSSELGRDHAVAALLDPRIDAIQFRIGVCWSEWEGGTYNWMNRVSGKYYLFIVWREIIKKFRIICIIHNSMITIEM